MDDHASNPLYLAIVFRSVHSMSLLYTLCLVYIVHFVYIVCPLSIMFLTIVVGVYRMSLVHTVCLLCTLCVLHFLVLVC